MKITGHTGSVTIRSQENVSGSSHRLIGKKLPKVPNLRRNIAFVPPSLRSLADSSCLNRPIVGPTPPKLPVSDSNLRHHRVLPRFRRCLFRLLHCFYKVKRFLNFSSFFHKIRRLPCGRRRICQLCSTISSQMLALLSGTSPVLSYSETVNPAFFSCSTVVFSFSFLII